MPTEYFQKDSLEATEAQFKMMSGDLGKTFKVYLCSGRVYIPKCCNAHIYFTLVEEISNELTWPAEDTGQPSSTVPFGPLLSQPQHKKSNMDTGKVEGKMETNNKEITALPIMPIFIGTDNTNSAKTFHRYSNTTHLPKAYEQNGDK